MEVLSLITSAFRNNDLTTSQKISLAADMVAALTLLKESRSSDIMSLRENMETILSVSVTPYTMFLLREMVEDGECYCVDDVKKPCAWCKASHFLKTGSRDDM